jgi:hypothetical protein
LQAECKISQQSAYLAQASAEQWISLYEHWIALSQYIHRNWDDLPESRWKNDLVRKAFVQARDELAREQLAVNTQYIVHEYVIVSVSAATAARDFSDRFLEAFLGIDRFMLLLEQFNRALTWLYEIQKVVAGPDGQAQ